MGYEGWRGGGEIRNPWVLCGPGRASFGPGHASVMSGVVISARVTLPACGADGR